MIATSSDTQTIKKLTVNAQNLSKCWAVGSRLSKDDWLEWLRRLSVGLLTESHSAAIRFVYSLGYMLSCSYD